MALFYNKVQRANPSKPRCSQKFAIDRYEKPFKKGAI
jgi:hypothetical protein